MKRSHIAFSRPLKGLTSAPFVSHKIRSEPNFIGLLLRPPGCPSTHSCSVSKPLRIESSQQLLRCPCTFSFDQSIHPPSIRTLVLPSSHAKNYAERGKRAARRTTWLNRVVCSSRVLLLLLLFGCLSNYSFQYLLSGERAAAQQRGKSGE